MVAWATLLKAGLPYVADIVAERLPAFTKRQDEAKNVADLTAQQIAELQQAAQHNATSIKALAEQLQQTVKAVEAGAGEHERVIGELQGQIAELAQQRDTAEQERDTAQQERDVLRRRIESARWVSLIAFGTAFLALSLAIFGTLV